MVNFKKGRYYETIMLHVNTKDNENGRRRRDRPLGLSNRKGTNLKVCPYSVVFGGDFRVKYIGCVINRQRVQGQTLRSVPTSLQISKPIFISSVFTVNYIEKCLLKIFCYRAWFSTSNNTVIYFSNGC